MVLVVFIPERPTQKYLDEYLRVSRLYREGKVSEDDLKKAEQEYQQVVEAYKWRSG